MPKDNAPMPLTFAEMLADMEREDFDPVEIGNLPPFEVIHEIKRHVRTLPIPDLNAFTKLWLLTGEGNTGKTFLARYLIERITEAGKGDRNIFAALAQGNRNLTAFAAGIMQPPGSEPMAVADWANKRLTVMQRARYGGVWDFGGGDSSQRLMLQAQPDMADRAEQDGMAIVAAYTFSPRLDDLIFLKTFERMGFHPRATALILNLGRASSPSSFNDLRRQPEYKAALDRGAVEIWLPALEEKIALAIERQRLMFQQACDGRFSDDKQPSLSLTDCFRVRCWLGAMQAEFSDVEKAGWMLWT